MINIGAFNLGNAIGAMTGAMVLNMGLNYTAVSLAGAGLAALSLLLLLIQIRMQSKKKDFA